MLRVPGLARNSAMSSLQAVAGAVVLFGSYKALVMWHGPDALGLWSLIGAFTLSIRLFDPSGGASIGRFVAIAQANEARGSTGVHSAITYADSALIVMMMLYTVMCLIAWLPIQWLLETQIDDPATLKDAMAAFPVMLALVPVIVFGTSCADALDGIQRADLRALAMIGGFGILAAMIFALVPRYGLIGFAVAQVIQYLVVAVVARMLLIKKLDEAKLLPTSFNLHASKELLRYGFKLQAASLANTLAEPLTKVLLNHFGGLSILGIYEISSKLVVQIRSVIVGAAVPLLPVFATETGLTKDGPGSLIRKSNRVVAMASLAMFLLSIVGGPVLSWLILDEINTTLLEFTAILATGFAFNTLALPFYLQAQATGVLKWNILGQLSIGLVTIATGPIFATLLGGHGIVLAFALGLSVAGAIFILSGLIRNNINLRNAWGID